MIQHPGILALGLGSLLTVFLLFHAAWTGLAILRHWDLASGEARQLQLERRATLASTLLGLALPLQLASLFLFLHTADELHGRLSGAMCAAGVLAANAFGGPALRLKVALALGAGLWLLLHHLDRQAPDFPLVRVKAAASLLLLPLALAEAAVQGAFFLNLHADVITSCCGSLFSPEGAGAEAGLATLPPGPVVLALGLSALAFAGAAAAFLRGHGRGGWVALTGGATWLASLAFLVVKVGPYLYELPTHLCPFCMVQGEYHHLGYAFYALWLLLGIAGLGVGALAPFRARASLKTLAPALQRRLTWAALLGLGAFLALAGGVIAASNLHGA